MPSIQYTYVRIHITKASEASEACVRVDEEVSEWFEVKQGVRQGCPLSPWLFNIFLDMVVREARTNFHGGVKLDTCQVQVLLFADDTVLVTEREEDLQHNIRALHTAVKAQAGSKLDKNQHDGNWQGDHWV